MPKILQLTAERLGYGSLDAASVNVDWAAAFGEDLEGCEVIYPSLTLGMVEEYAPELLTPAQVRYAQVHPSKPASAELAEAFGQSDREHEWRDSYQPMMNGAYPVFIYDGGPVTPGQVADLLEQFAPACSLIHFGEHSDFCPEPYGFALTGGGMDLSDHIAAAYLCAAQVPPTWVLQRLAGVGMSEHKLARIGPALALAFDMAAKALCERAEDLTREKARVFKSAT